MNGTKYAPGAARPDLQRLVLRPSQDFPVTGLRVGMLYARAMLRETHPENFYATGTDLRAEQHPCQLDASADDCDRILRNHRRMAHMAWVREIEAEHARGSEAAAYRAWLSARRHCGLPT